MDRIGFHSQDFKNKRKDGPATIPNPPFLLRARFFYKASFRRYIKITLPKKAPDKGDHKYDPSGLPG